MSLLFWGGGLNTCVSSLDPLSCVLCGIYYNKTCLEATWFSPPHGSAHSTTCWDVREDPEDEIQDTPTALVVALIKTQ